MNTRTILEVESLSLRFGGVVALHDVSLAVDVGELVGLIGANGSGKTSLCNAISGLYVPQQGSVRLRGEELVGREPHQIARLGVARTFQGIELFGHMTVLENVLLGRHVHWTGGAGRVLVGPFERRQTSHQSDEAERAIELLELTAHRHAVACNLPYGLRKRVELARAMAMAPSVLILDEPTAGMSSVERSDTAVLITRLNRETRVTVVLVEHNVPFVRAVVGRLVVLDAGAVLTQGAPAEVLADRRVVAAYLGRSSPKHDTPV